MTITRSNSPSQSRHGSNGNEEIFYILQCSRSGPSPVYAVLCYIHDSPFRKCILSLRRGYSRLILNRVDKVILKKKAMDSFWLNEYHFISALLFFEYFKIRNHFVIKEKPLFSLNSAGLDA